MSSTQSLTNSYQIGLVNKELEEAMRTSDPQRLAAIYSTEGQLLPPNNRIVSGVEDITAYWRGVIAAGITEANLTTEELNFFGETALEVGSYVMQSGETTADIGKYIVIWKNENGHWKYHRDIWNSNLSQ